MIKERGYPESKMKAVNKYNEEIERKRKERERKEKGKNYKTQHVSILYFNEKP